MAAELAAIPALAPGAVAWASLDPVRGREQRGHRPVVVVASAGYLDAVTTLVMVVPVTTVDRGWPNHIALTGGTGLETASWAMTEQVRTLPRSRMDRVTGEVGRDCLREIRTWLADFLDLEPR
jgi:mRNA interferase MazF